MDTIIPSYFPPEFNIFKKINLLPPIYTSASLPITCDTGGNLDLAVMY